MAYRIFITGSGLAPQARQWLQAQGCCLRFGHREATSAEIAQALAEFQPHALIVREGRITERVLASAASLRVVCKHGVGTDNIDVESASRYGLPVLFTPGANDEAVAEHALALMLALSRDLAKQQRQVRKGVCDKAGYKGWSLAGKCLGLIGFGRSARRLAGLVAPLGMTVLAYHPSCTAEALAEHVHKTPHQREVFERADVLSLHCPLTPRTRHLVDAPHLAAMKKGACLINTARGGLIREAALRVALANGQLGAAALDVFETEPPPADHPLLALPNVIVSGHIAGVSDTSRLSMGMASARLCLSALRGDTLEPSCVENPDALTASRRPPRRSR